MVKTERKYDLEERTALFGESVIRLYGKVRQDNIISPIVHQLIRSATSVGANYMEANGASSKKDFINKIFICKKELQETKHWLRMLHSSQAKSDSSDPSSIQKECQELILIFTKLRGFAHPLGYREERDHKWAPENILAPFRFIHLTH